MAKIVYNSIIPFSGYQAITIWPVIFARKRFKPLKEHVVNHESIHLRQQVEVGVMRFERKSPRLKPWDESAVFIFN